MPAQVVRIHKKMFDGYQREWCFYCEIHVTEVPPKMFDSSCTHVYKDMLECLDIQQKNGSNGS
jgi:hypothetical protein